MAIVGHLQAANASVQAGNFAENNQEVRVDAGNLFTRREDLEAVVVGVVRGHPVYLRDVAEKIVDGAAEPADYVVYGTTNAGAIAQARQYPAVTITVAKRKGTNATDISNAVLKRVHEMQGVTHSQRRDGDHHAELRRDGEGQVGRTAGAPAAGHTVRHLARRALPGMARVGRGAAGHSGYARAHHVGVLLPGLHHQSRHAVRVDLLASAFLSMTPSSWSKTWCATSACRRIMAGR